MVLTAWITLPTWSTGSFKSYDKVAGSCTLKIAYKINGKCSFYSCALGSRFSSRILRRMIPISAMSSQLPCFGV